MERSQFYYKVITELCFTEAEVDILMRCSERHYDLKCRSLAKLGGFLYGMKNGFLLDSSTSSATRTLSIAALDSLCKVIESPQDADEKKLCSQLQVLLVEASAEHGRVNRR